MNRTDAVWVVGRLTIGTWVRIVARLRVYGAERVPRQGGVVLAFGPGGHLTEERRQRARPADLG